MDYCPFFILFGGNTPLQGADDTGGDPASAHSQRMTGQTQLLGGGFYIFIFYIFIYIFFIYIHTHKHIYI